MAGPNLSVLDDVLADRKVDPGEADTLVVVTDHERRDLNDVALLLGLPMTAVEQTLETSSTFAGGCDMPIGSLRLSPGDRICFTGETSMPRDDLQAFALAAGLEATSTVSKKARTLGTAVISEPKFHQLLAILRER